MRLLQVVPTYFPAVRYGGPIYSVHGLSRALVALGHQVEVVTTSVDGDRDSDVPLHTAVDLDGVTVRYFPSRVLRRLYFSPSLSAFMGRHVRDYDVVHIHSLFLYPTLAAAVAARRSQQAHVISPRGMLIGELIARRNRLLKRAWLRIFDRNNLQSASAVHFTSDLERQEAAELGYRFRRTMVVPNGIDLEDAGGAPASSSPPYILYLGRLSWKKGLDRLIAALPFCPEVRLIIAGNDDEHYLDTVQRLSRDHGVEARVEYVGRVDGAAKKRWLTNAVSLVLPSYSENFGNVVLEAMALGCPVVVTPEVGLSPVIASDQCGIVTDGEPQTLGHAIATLAGDAGLRRQLGERGRATVARRFTWPAVARQMANEYEALLATGREQYSAVGT